MPNRGSPHEGEKEGEEIEAGGKGEGREGGKGEREGKGAKNK